MRNDPWEARIGGRPQGLIPVLLLLALFGGLSIWLYVSDNGAFLFLFLLAILAFAILLAVLYRAFFVKVLLYEDGFYHKTRPGNGRFIGYRQLKKAWKSS